METVFVEVLNMGLTATWVVLAVFAVRALCYRAPKSLLVCLWALVGLRLLAPFLPESILSLIPSATIVSPDILRAEQPEIHTGVAMLNSTVNPIISEHLAPEYNTSSVPAPAAGMNPIQMIAFGACAVWIAGMGIMFSYSLYSYFLLRNRVKASLCYRDNIFFCDSIATPFVFGVIKPRIYLPSGMEEGTIESVIAHETAHLKRKDHWWKTLGFGLLSVYWFHPLLWVAYMLFSKDVERACDERVIKELDKEARKNYAQALVSCSLQKRRMFACPLSFGEVGVKNRVKSVLNYKKPAFWIVAATVVAGIGVAVCFLTNPLSESDKPDENADSLTIIGGADGPTAVLVDSWTEGSIRWLRERYPRYFDLDISEGLEVYVWQMAGNSYSCGLVSGKESREIEEKTEGIRTDLWGLEAVTVTEMKLILSDYRISKEEVTIIPYGMPHSSYLNGEAAADPEGYLRKLEAMFWGED